MSTPDPEEQKDYLMTYTIEVVINGEKVRAPGKRTLFRQTWRQVLDARLQTSLIPEMHDVQTWSEV